MTTEENALVTHHVASPAPRTQRGTHVRKAHGQSGFTLIELLSVIALTGILLSLGAVALRQFWFVRALHGEQDEIVTQLRNLQERVVAESNPLVFGAKFSQGGTSTTWNLIRFDPFRDPGSQCTLLETITMDAGVRIQNSSFPVGGAVTDVCRGELGGAGNDYLFFFARGNATPGAVTIFSPRLDGRRLKVCVNGVTGRVEKRDVSAAC